VAAHELLERVPLSGLGARDERDVGIIEPSADVRASERAAAPSL
jgi:hypothetical protein